MNVPKHWTHDRTHFYKYVTDETANRVLTTGKLRWSIPRRFNDPFDLQFDLDVNIDRRAVKIATLQKSWEAHYGDVPPRAGNELGVLIRASRHSFPKLSRDEFDLQMGDAIDEGIEAGLRDLPRFHQEVRDHMASEKILCLSAVPDQTLMWSHYAQSHTGLVLRFRCVPELDSVWGIAKPVRYVDRMPHLFDDEFLSDLLSGRISLDAREIRESMIYTKAAIWSYEQEWRICAGSGRTRNDYEDWAFNPIELDGVIFGYASETNCRRTISKLVSTRYPHAHLFEIRKKAREFGLAIVPMAPPNYS